jgi:hypothetical protein
MRNVIKAKEIYAERFTGPGASASTGTTYYVHSTRGSDNRNSGLTPDTPFKTLDYAIGRCAANKGDVIYVMPGHAENLTTATAINIDVAGISIIGLGEGNLIPKFSLTALAGSITFGAANCTVENIWVYSNATDGVTNGLTVAATAAGSTLRKIKMTEAANTKEFLTWVAIATGIADLTIEDCFLQGIIGGSDVNAIIFAGTSTNCVIRNNYIYADCSGDLIDHNAGASVTIRIQGNRLCNMDTGAAGDVISLKSDGTGYITGNYGFCNKNDATVFTGAAAVWHQNYGSNTLGDSGILFPAAAAAIP